MKNAKRKRQTPPPPLCPIHNARMLVGHVAQGVQYRYCCVAGCRQSLQTNRKSKPALADCAIAGCATSEVADEEARKQTSPLS